MTNKMHQMSDIVDAIYHFDHFFQYSDDHKVWEAGQARRQEIVDMVNKANLTEEDKTLIFDKIGARMDMDYRQAVATYGDTIAKRPLWNEGDSEIRSSVASLVGIRRDLLQNASN